MKTIYQIFGPVKIKAGIPSPNSEMTGLARLILIDYPTKEAAIQAAKEHKQIVEFYIMEKHIKV